MFLRLLVHVIVSCCCIVVCSDVLFLNLLHVIFVVCCVIDFVVLFCFCLRFLFCCFVLRAFALVCATSAILFYSYTCACCCWWSIVLVRLLSACVVANLFVGVCVFGCLLFV